MSRAWMPLYVADFVADTMHLSRANRGSYMSLICHYWRHGGLPKELALLQQIASIGLAEWEIDGPILQAFFTVKDGRWIHKRIEKELQTAENKYEKRSEAGRKGGLAKASNAKILLEHCSTNHNHIIKKEKISKKEKSFKHELPEGWQPDESDLAYGKKLGLLEGHFEGQVEALRLWAKANKILKVDWHATLKGFLRRDAEKRGVIAPSNGHDQNGFVFIKQDTPQWNAWTSYYLKSKGKSPPTNTQGGWYFPTDWPPGEPSKS